MWGVGRGGEGLSFIERYPYLASVGLRPFALVQKFLLALFFEQFHGPFFVLGARELRYSELKSEM